MHLHILIHLIENLTSLVVSPAFIPSCFSNSANILSEPLTKQTVPRHTLILYFPLGSVVK